MRIRQWLEAGRAVVRNLALGGNVAALSLLRSPGMLVSYTAESLFLLRSMTGRRGVTRKNVFEVFDRPQTLDVTLGNLAGETWLRPIPTSTVDILSLCLLCRVLDPAAVFEIGTLNGYTALHLALNTRDDARVFTLDLPPGAPLAPALRTTIIDDAHIRAGTEPVRRVFEGTDAARKIVPLHGDSARFDFSPYHGAVDMFFIDGAHSYDYVASDTRNALQCVRPGGVIAWHDFGRYGVNGVTRLVQEVARDRQVHVIPGGSLAFTVVSR